MYCKFHPNPVLTYMEYVGTDLSIRVGRKVRTYSDVPRELAYRLAYSRDASSAIYTYSTEIKGKFKVKKVC